MIWDLLLKVDPEGPTLIAATACAHRFSDHLDHPFCVLLQHTVVATKPVGGLHIGFDQFKDRPDSKGSGADLIRQRRDRQVNPLAFETLALSFNG